MAQNTASKTSTRSDGPCYMDPRLQRPIPPPPRGPADAAPVQARFEPQRPQQNDFPPARLSQTRRLRHPPRPNTPPPNPACNGAAPPAVRRPPRPHRTRPAMAPGNPPCFAGEDGTRGGYGLGRRVRDARRSRARPATAPANPPCAAGETTAGSGSRGTRDARRLRPRAPIWNSIRAEVACARHGVGSVRRSNRRAEPPAEPRSSLRRPSPSAAFSLVIPFSSSSFPSSLTG